MKKEIRLTQEPFIDGYDGACWYQAAAVDAEGEEYIVIWDIDNPDEEDEHYAVDDWHTPTAVTLWGADVTDDITLKLF